MRYDIQEKWTNGETNTIGPYPTFDAAVVAAGRRLRGYTQSRPVARIFELGNGIEKLVAIVRVTEDK